MYRIIGLLIGPQQWYPVSMTGVELARHSCSIIRTAVYRMGIRYTEIGWYKIKIVRLNESYNQSEQCEVSELTTSCGGQYSTAVVDKR